MNKIKENLFFLYNKTQGQETYNKLYQIITSYKKKIKKSKKINFKSWNLGNKDVFLITYGNQFQIENYTPLKILLKASRKYFKGLISGIHILPFFPYSSDEGFSVIDYKKVNSDFGEWKHIYKLAKRFKLMFDLVCNHISAESDWFRGYINQQEPYKNYFIELPKNSDLSRVVRPRISPLLTPIKTKSGQKFVWTTFSKDQIDLNYSNPEVLLAILDILLFYISRGATVIRLDAIAYLWKDVGTTCIHLKQTHKIVQLMRSVLDEVCPWAIIITETNVPHKENISYFGNGKNEAQMVYQFSLPPLLFYSIINKSTERLTSWAKTLDNLHGKTTYFNFCASHDGIGILPLKGLVPDKDLNELINIVKKKVGYVSYKSTSEGNIPYELNINYLDAVVEKNDTIDLKAKKFILTQAVLLCLKGVPGIYVHSFFGSQNDRNKSEKSGIKRDINRAKFDYNLLKKEINDKRTLRSKVYNGYKRLLLIRKKYSSFDPFADQEILELHSNIFALIRKSKISDEIILCIHNFIDKNIKIKINLKKIKEKIKTDKISDIISEKKVNIRINNNEFELVLNPYEIIWYKF